jgi:hypothetical protein
MRKKGKKNAKGTLVELTWPHGYLGWACVVVVHHFNFEMNIKRHIIYYTEKHVDFEENNNTHVPIREMTNSTWLCISMRRQWKNGSGNSNLPPYQALKKPDSFDQNSQWVTDRDQHLVMPWTLHDTQWRLQYYIRIYKFHSWRDI